MKRFWSYLATMWQPLSVVLAIGFILTLLFTYRLGSLVPGAAAIEHSNRISSQSISVIIDNPINAPYKSFQFIGQNIHKSIIVERLISGIIAAIIVLLFYYVVRQFCIPYAAFATTLLLASSSSLLANGRLASPQISLLFLFALCVSCYRILYKRPTSSDWLLTTVMLAFSLYTPGILYFVVLGILWQQKHIRSTLRELPNLYIAGQCLLLILLLAPLFYGILHTPSLWREYLGLPEKLPTVFNFVKNTIAVPVGIAVFAPMNSLYRLGRQPLLDVFTVILFIVGAYHFSIRYKLKRFIFMAGILVIGTLFVALSANYENTLMILPFIFILIADGMSFLLNEWNKVFPQNPLARWLAIGLMSCAVLVASNFQTRRYFIAWPNNPTTRQIFSIK